MNHRLITATLTAFFAVAGSAAYASSAAAGPEDHGQCTAAQADAKDVLQYVNPFIGTTNFGTTNPGAVCPQGMMSGSLRSM